MFFLLKKLFNWTKKAILSITIIKLDKKYENNYWVPIKNNTTGAFTKKQASFHNDGLSQLTLNLIL